MIASAAVSRAMSIGFFIDNYFFEKSVVAIPAPTSAPAVSYAMSRSVSFACASSPDIAVPITMSPRSSKNSIPKPIVSERIQSVANVRHFLRWR